MAERRLIVEGMKVSDPKEETQQARELLRLSKAIAPDSTPPIQPVQQIVRAPISSRMRTDFQAALKRASVENRLASKEPSSVQYILEQAVEPWLKQHGFLD